MNAPTVSVSKEATLLLAANETLENVYFDRADPCVALLVSRNYRLLVDCPAPQTFKLAWIQQSKYWWQQYLKGTTGKVRYSALLEQSIPTVFKPVDGL